MGMADEPGGAVTQPLPIAEIPEPRLEPPKTAASASSR
jgi:hypothetical protein